MALKKRNRVEATFAMSSMTDLIFLLLLFFVMASTQATPTDLDINLPSSSSKKKTTAENIENVSIDANGAFKVMMDGHETYVEEAQLKAYLTDKHAQDPTMMVKLYVEKAVSFDYVVKVLDIANQQQIRLVVATDRK